MLNCPQCIRKIAVVKQFLIAIDGQFRCNDCSFEWKRKKTLSFLLGTLVEILMAVFVFVLIVFYQLSLWLTMTLLCLMLLIACAIRIEMIRRIFKKESSHG